MVNEMPRHKDRFILFLNRLVSFTSPIDPLVCTPEPFPSGIALPPCLCAPIHRHFRLSRSKNAPATSLLRPSSRSPTSINDYYHLIYVLYAYRGLFGARSAPVASCLLLSDIPIRALNELAQRNTVEDRCRRAWQSNNTIPQILTINLRTIFSSSLPICRCDSDASARISSSLLWRG